MNNSASTEPKPRSHTLPNIRSRKTLVVAAVTALLLGISGVAFAYWTNQGAGTGSGTTGTNEAITINQTSTVTDLVPGGAPQALDGDFTNLNDGTVYVATVTVSVGEVTKAVGAAAGDCDASDYTITNPTVDILAEIPSGTNVAAFSGPTVAFNNKSTNQDGCKSAIVEFLYASI